MAARKQRPGVVVLDVGDADVVIAPVTSKSRSGTGDIALKNSYAAGLVRVSWVRLGKVATLLKGDVVKKLGRLDGSERNEVATK